MVERLGLSSDARPWRGALIVLLSFIALLVAAQFNTAYAQAAGPVVLNAVTVSAGSPGETRIVLTFSRPPPQYSIITNDSDRPAIVLSGTVRGQTARVANGPQGLLRSIAFQQNETVLVMTLTGAGPIRISASPLDAQSITVSIIATPRAGRPVSASLPQPLSAHVDAGNGFEVVFLKYADVSEIVGLLSAGAGVKPNDVFYPQQQSLGSAVMSDSYGAGVQPSLPTANMDQNTGTPDDAFGQSIDDTIGIDRRLNAIILKGPPELIEQLKEKIAKLDVPVASVVLETIFVELTESGAKNVGLDFNNTNAQVGIITYESGIYSPSAISPVGPGQFSAALQVAIYAQVQKGQGRIISKPRIAAQSGSVAKIVTGDALPILTAITLSGVNGVSQQVQYVNVGVTLQIAPRVTADGFVTSHIFCKVSSVTGVSQGYPTISQREATTSATVKDGESFVIGGLTQENQLSTTSKIPLLGDVPLLGRLFSLDRGTTSNTDLYIVITPHIVRRADASVANTETTDTIITPILSTSDELACTDSHGAVTVQNGQRMCVNFAAARAAATQLPAPAK